MADQPTKIIHALVQGYIERFPEEAVRALEELPAAEIIPILKKTSITRITSLLERMVPDIASDILREADDDFSRQILSAIDPGVGAAMLARLDQTIRDHKLSLLSSPRARTLRSLIEYPPDSAGALMDPRVMTFRPEATVREVLSKVRKLGRRRVQDIFVIDGETRLIGSVSLQEVAVSRPAERIGALVTARPATVNALANKEDVLDLIARLKLISVPVVDFEGRILGVIRHDRLVTAAQEEMSADLQTMVGASKEERALSRVSFAVRKRLPWLQINLGTAFLAAAVVGLFEGTIARFTALAVLLPVVAGQSGNTGAQALAVTMRGLSLREIRLDHWLKVSLKEVQAGFINGCVVALTTSFFVLLWSQSMGLAMVIGIAMVFSMVIAGLAGAGIPMLLSAAGQDPAQSSSILLTTVTDVVGFFSFLGIATVLADMI